METKTGWKTLEALCDLCSQSIENIQDKGQSKMIYASPKIICTEC